MTAMRKNSSLITILAFGLYFLVGAGALLVGSSLTQLIGVYGRTMDAVVLLGSSFAIGRVSTVGLTGRLVEKIGAKAVYAISVLATCVYFVLPGWPCRSRPCPRIQSVFRSSVSLLLLDMD